MRKIDKGLEFFTIIKIFNLKDDLFQRKKECERIL